MVSDKRKIKKILHEIKINITLAERWKHGSSFVTTATTNQFKLALRNCIPIQFASNNCLRTHFHFE